MSTKFKIVTSLIFLVLFQAPVKAQFFLSYSVGVTEHDVQILSFGDNHYGAMSPSFLNFGMQYKSEKSRWSLSMSSQNTKLTPNLEEIDYFEGTHRVDHTELVMGLEYLRKVHESTTGIIALLGMNYTARTASFTNTIQSEFLEGSWDFEEDVVFDLSIVGAAEYTFGDKLLRMKMGIGILNYRYATQKYWRNEKEFYGTGPSVFFQLRNEIFLQIPVINRIFIRPEYTFKYHTYREYSVMKALQQHFLIGGVFQL
ncbi:MAG TPA: hypothetical protein DD671_19115 [Balneolaceae bacterium]|mgnify:FL=1|nr:hypothetical protein [Balneolaceae bacterium]